MLSHSQGVNIIELCACLNLVSMSEEGVDVGYGDFEFERTFLANEPPGMRRETPALIVQGYFLAQDGYGLRIRLLAQNITLDDGDVAATAPSSREVAARLLDEYEQEFDFCALTAKGPYVGGTRYEAERELDVSVGAQMLRRCDNLVVKNRYPMWLGADGWVIDVFAGGNAGLVLAEVERGGPVVDLVIPPFCRSEVTDDPRFGNEYLAVHPWRTFAADVDRELLARGPRFLTEFGANTFSAPEEGTR